MEPIPAIPTAPYRDVYTVSRLNREARLLLEGGFPSLWLEGEVSNLARPSSGHIYFCLKDAQAQIRCALFRGQVRALATAPRDGMHVLVRARVTLYEGRGEFQLVIEHLEEAGEGALRRAFEALKVRLAKEGLFDAQRKRPIPRLPRRIGVITSPSGAVLHDILSTLARRFPAIPVVLYPVPVQGEGAAERIASMIGTAGARGECDVLILARGGGSLEDLWAFNEEVVARALAACPIPVVSGVGHETDFTIADLAADVRAPTPTAAAELVSPDRAEWLVRVDAIGSRLAHCMRQALDRRAQHVDWLSARLVHPRHRLQIFAERLQALTTRLMHAGQRHTAQRRSVLHAWSARLWQRTPLARVRTAHMHCQHLHARLMRATTRRLELRHGRLAQLAQSLEALSPLRTLARGYAIAQTSEGAIVRDADDVRPGDAIDVRLARGGLRCRVTDRTR